MKINYFEYVNNFFKYSDIKSIKIIKGKINNPKITIAIPTYKRNHLIKDAISSAINQKDFKDYEIIIVDNDDDFNNKELENIIKEYKNDKISYYKNEKNIGMYGNWNRCIELAKGEYISILNDDDWLEINFLKEICRHIDGKRAIYTETIINDFRNTYHVENINKLKRTLKKIYTVLKKIKKVKKLKLVDFFYGNKSAGSLGILFNKEAMISLGGYNENFFPSADFFFHTYYCVKYGTVLLKAELCNYRVQENESMKKNTAILWIEQGEDFRNFLVNKYLKNRKYIEECKIVNECFKKSLEFWGFKFDYNKKLANNKKLKIKKYLRDIF